MRLKLNLSHAPNAVLPINYAYCISAWIYKTFARADAGFASWLHERGYGYGGKHYKLFTFGPLRPRRFDVPLGSDRFVLVDGPTELVLSFYLDEAVEHFVAGLFREQRFGLGDHRSQADFEVITLEILSPPRFEPTIRFRLLTPCCLSRDAPGKRHPDYLHPEDAGYGEAFLGHLVRKYLAVPAHQSAVEGEEELFLSAHLGWRLFSEPRSRLLDVKGVRIRGYMYDFELTAPMELMELGYYTGFGEKNSGAGMGMADPD